VLGSTFSTSYSDYTISTVTSSSTTFYVKSTDVYWIINRADLLDMSQWRKGVTLILSKDQWLTYGEDAIGELFDELVRRAEEEGWDLVWTEQDHAFETWIQIK